MKIGIFGRVLNNKEAVEFFKGFIDYLKELKIEFSIFREFDQYLREEYGLDFQTELFDENFSKNTADTDFIISVGGDGTLLHTLSIVRDSGIPVLGINTGRLGFLASIAKENIRGAFDELLKGGYMLDKRSILQIESDQDLFQGFNYALNDFVIHKKDTSSMITVHTFLNGEFLNSYWADGLIVSTPTGSTGYALSCGGPIIFPRSSTFVITPIAPHNLNVRPIIVSDDNVISFEIEGRSSSYLTSLDSRSVSINSSVQIAVRKADFTFNLVRLNNENYLNTLRKKLMWGLDNRN